MSTPMDDAGDESPPRDYSREASPKSGLNSGRISKSEREKRTYRACLHCRQRKSRCDLYSSGEPGRPPCERCIREQHECVLGGSRRGGRRVKRSQPEESVQSAGPTPNNDSVSQPVPVSYPRQDLQSPSNGYDQRQTQWQGYNRESRILPPLPQEPPVQTSTSAAKLSVDDSVARHDIQNPADALEFLAHVAERDSGSNQLPPMHGYGRSQRLSPNTRALDDQIRSGERAGENGFINYPPLIKGQLTLEMVHILLARYADKYHQFFPIANLDAMEANNLASIAVKEPHLLTAILTVASKDEKDWWQIHEACSSHMQALIADLIYGEGASVEAVEAMLILAEWVPRRPESTSTVGRGEEDGAAWMFVGTAVRLGYLLGIDRTGFRTESDADSVELNRKRLAWAACYMSDRQISVRIGKAFWSRGPGPMTALRAQDFPALQPRPGRNDDFAAIFQANLELTQLFSNAHDVLYATKSRSNQLNFGGEYVKYIDDFRVALRSWYSTWGIFSCSPPLKASLILSYEYLRLYVNAFAYQATLNRLVAQVQATSNGQPMNPFGSDIAATPDARFIFDSIDAAKALLSTFNSFVDPAETFRFMPLRYYLYVIYSACFLYKARATGVLAGDSRGSIKRMILDTIDRLHKASACTNDVGDRYSRLVRLLWRKPPGRGSIAEGADLSARHILPQPRMPSVAGAANAAGGPDQPDQPMYDNAPPSINTFSWLDLGAVGDFALTNNESIAGSFDGLDRFDDSSTDGFGPFEQNMILPQFQSWNDLSPSGIVF